MSADEEPGETSSAENEHPLEVQTQPMKADPLPTTDDVRASADTTTLGMPLPPPIRVDEEEPSPIDQKLLSPTPGSTASLAPSSSLRPMLLERIEPSLGRGERLRLDAAHWKVSLGRAEECDIRLYTASASRQHATITGTERGEWLLTPLAGKTVGIDGESVSEPLVLEMGMNIVLGQDHLRCVAEGLAPGEMAARTAAEGPGESDSKWLETLKRLAARLGVTGSAIVVAVCAALLWFLLGRGGN